MKIVALLSWYSEDPQWLRDMVATLPSVGVTDLVAVDGAYDRFPGGQRQSDDKQHRALIRECKRQGIALTLHVPPRTWETEMEKRTHLFRLAETVTSEKDWYMVMDGDELVDRVPKDLAERLASSSFDAGQVTFSEPHPERRTKRFSIPIFFRAIRGLEVIGNHYTFTTPDGRNLWGQGRYERPLDLTDLVILHRTHMRAKTRKDATHAYYRKRDEDKVEIGKCRRCGKQGIDEIPHEWQMLDKPPVGQPKDMGYLSAIWVAVCADCKPVLEEENRVKIRELGLVPERAKMTHELVEVQ